MWSPSYTQPCKNLREGRVSHTYTEWLQSWACSAVSINYHHPLWGTQKGAGQPCLPIVALASWVGIQSLFTLPLSLLAWRGCRPCSRSYMAEEGSEQWWHSPVPPPSPWRSRGHAKWPTHLPFREPAAAIGWTSPGWHSRWQGHVVHFPNLWPLTCLCLWCCLGNSSCTL
jgi:hypothetical protein